MRIVQLVSYKVCVQNDAKHDLKRYWGTFLYRKPTFDTSALRKYLLIKYDFNKRLFFSKYLARVL